MERKWTFRRRNYTMVTTGYGQYSLNGYHCTDSSIWDYVTDDENLKMRGKARAHAEAIVKCHVMAGRSWR